MRSSSFSLCRILSWGPKGSPRPQSAHQAKGIWSISLSVRWACVVKVQGMQNELLMNKCSLQALNCMVWSVEDVTKITRPLHLPLAYELECTFDLAGLM